MPPSDLPTLVRACRLYYLEDRSQEEIARQLRLSRPSVSRLLDRARRQRIVEFRIRDETENAAWQELAARLGLESLVVAGGTGLEAVGAAAAERFLRQVSPGAVVGLTAGRTLSSLVAQLRPERPLDLEIVPLVGALWETGQEYDGSFLCQELRRRAGGTHWVLSVPAVVRDAELARQLRAEPRVRIVLDRYPAVQHALLGIGDATNEHPLVQAAAPRAGRRSTPLLPRQAFVSVGCLFFDRHGSPCATSLDSRTLGMSHAELARVPSRVGLAAGRDKVQLVRALLRGRLLTTLVVDTPLASALEREAGGSSLRSPTRRISP